MGKLEKLIQFVLNIVLLQFLAFFVVESINPVVFLPFPLMGYTTKCSMHIMFSIFALIISLVTYD